MVYVPGEIQAAAKSKAVTILNRDDFISGRAMGQDGAIHRKPPVEIVHPYDDMLEAERIKVNDVVEPNVIYDFTIENGILVGDRAFLTSDPTLLLTDSTHSRHLPWIFESADRRNFEGVRLEPAEGGYVFSKAAAQWEELKGTVCALTAMEYDNYGAFLVRLIPKLINIRNLSMDLDAIIAPQNRWQQSILTSFGVNPKKIIAHDRSKNYRADRLVALGMRSSEMYMDDVSMEFFKEHADRTARHDDRQRSERIYVSRLNQSRKNPNHRRLLNEDKLIAALAARGFDIFAPEEHSFEEQVKVFAAAKVVIGPGGAGMFNAVFCKSSALVVSLEPMMNWIALHSNMFASSDVNYALVVGGADKSDVSVQKRWSTDVNCVLSVLDRCGA